MHVSQGGGTDRTVVTRVESSEQEKAEGSVALPCVCVRVCAPSRLHVHTKELSLRDPFETSNWV